MVQTVKEVGKARNVLAAGERATATRMRRDTSVAQRWIIKRNAYLQASFQRRIAEINRGADADDLVGAAEVLQVPREQLYDLVGLSVSTAKRKLAKNEKLDPYVTERLMQIGAVEKLAEDVFGDRNRASEWLKTSNAGLGSVAPLSVLSTEIGRREVSRILNAIAYGGAA